LSDLESTKGSLTAELVRRFRQAIDDGVLAPGEQLPTTRELAREAGINAMTAARVYRRLRELGYVHATVGRGTFVRELRPFAADDLDEDWQSVVLPTPRRGTRERPLQDAIRLARKDGIISLAVGLPDPSTLPLDEIRAAASWVFSELGPLSLSYTDVEGLSELRDQLGMLGRREGFAQGGDEILVTSGARQAIDLVCRTVLDERDVACVESPSFAGMLASLEATGAHLIGIPTDADGLDVEALERVLARHPVKLVALQPACHNPTGRHLAADRRARLIELARERSFFVLEDAVYAELTFTGASPKALRGDAPAHVIHVNSLSKTVGGGLRIGWIAASGPIVNRLVDLKMGTDINTTPLAQRIAARYLATGGYERLIERVTPYYRDRAEALQRALEQHLAGEVDVLEPLGGHNLWATLRRRVNENALYAEALSHGVTITPGSTVQLEPSPRTAVRLSFSLASAEELDEGARRLAQAFRTVLRTSAFGATTPAA
jgi:2-aminoadipate transaminase